MRVVEARLAAYIRASARSIRRDVSPAVTVRSAPSSISRHTTPMSIRTPWSARRKSSSDQSILLHGVAEPFRDPGGLDVVGQVRRQEAELIATEPCMEIRCAIAVDAGARPDVRPEEVGHALEDTVAHAMAKGIVVELELRHVGQTHRAPSSARCGRQECLQPFDERGELHQLCFGIAACLVGEIADELLEIVRERPHARLFRRELLPDTLDLFGASSHDGLDCRPFGLAPAAFLQPQHGVDGGDQVRFAPSVQAE